VKNIAISLHAGGPAQRNAITKVFVDEKWAYWHWIDDFWIVQVPDTYTPKTLHDRLEALEPVGAATILVFEFHGRITFWGRSPNEAWAWLNHIGNAG